MRLPDRGGGVLQHFGIIVRAKANRGMIWVARVVAKATVLFVINLVGNHVAKFGADARHAATCFAKLLGVSVPATIVPRCISPMGVLMQNNQRADALAGIGLNNFAIVFLVGLLWSHFPAGGPKDKSHPAQPCHAVGV